MPKIVLLADTVYSGDNGRLICLQCAGYAAKVSGRDSSGQKVKRLARVNTISCHGQFGRPLKCEAGCTVYPLPEAGKRYYAVRRDTKTRATILGIGETQDGAWEDARVHQGGSRAALEKAGCRIMPYDGGSLADLATSTRP